jgi:hypothetical protein
MVVREQDMTCVMKIRRKKKEKERERFKKGEESFELLSRPVLLVSTMSYNS